MVIIDSFLNFFIFPDLNLNKQEFLQISFTENLNMDVLLKDEPLDLDFNLQEQFKSNDPNNNAVIGEITALVKEAQIFLQESEYEMKNMQDCFEKMKKRHTENIIIIFRVLQLLTTYSVSPVSVDQENVASMYLRHFLTDQAKVGTKPSQNLLKIGILIELWLKLLNLKSIFTILIRSKVIYISRIGGFGSSIPQIII